MGYAEVTQLGTVDKSDKVAYVYSPDNFKVYVSKSGHGTILKSIGAYGEKLYGGWCDLRTGRLWTTCGSTRNLKGRDLTEVKEAIESRYGIFLRVV